MADSLTTLAEAAVSSGYLPGNAWEAMLDRHMREHLQNTVRELGKEYQAYLTVQTNSAQEMMHSLLYSGTNPTEARNLALRELLPMAESDLADEQAMLRGEEMPDSDQPDSPSPSRSTAKATGATAI